MFLVSGSGIFVSEAGELGERDGSPAALSNLIAANAVATIDAMAAAGIPSHPVEDSVSIAATLAQADIANPPTDALPETIAPADTTPASPQATPIPPEAAPSLPEAAPILPEATPSLPEATPILPEATPIPPEVSSTDSMEVVPLPAAPAETLPQPRDAAESATEQPAPAIVYPDLSPILSPDGNTPSSDSIFPWEPNINLGPEEQYPLAGPTLAPNAAGTAYPVSQFTFNYALEGSKANRKLPKIDTLTKDPITLGKIAEMFVPAGKGTEDISLALDNLPPKSRFSAEALRELFSALQQRLNQQNVYGVLVSADPAQIDGDSLQDKRTTSPAPETLGILIYVGEVKQVRTITKQIEFKDDPALAIKERPENIKVREPNVSAIDAPRYSRIRAKSPLQSGSFLDRAELEDYLARLNRFPSRRVDVAINASGEPGGVILDYLVREDKPWTIFAQTTNTGTESTGEFRTQVGIEYRQLAKLDDIFTLDYTTSDFSSSNNLNGSYQITPIFPDVLKTKIYGSYGKFTASDVGFDNQEFEGESWKVGALLTWTPLRYRDFPLDLTLGAEWVDVSVNNQTFGGEGHGEFLIAYFDIGTDKRTDRYAISGSLRLETNLTEFTSTEDADLAALGRFSTSNDFLIGKFNFATSFFLEPLLLGEKFRTPNEPKTWTMAHEFAFEARGQYTFSDRRLIPQFEDTIGGFYTVRGYPESLAAGDNIYVGTAEYRLHVPRLLAPWKAPEGSPETARQMVGKFPFALRPSVVGEGVDFPEWDFIFRAFVDAGYSENNNIQVSSEADRTLVGAGIGFELQLKNSVSFRVDYGFALVEAVDLLVEPVDAGSGRFHLALSFVW